MNSEKYEDLLDVNNQWLSGWSFSHDYDPSWDYEIDFDNKEHPLFILAEKTLAELLTSSNIWESARVYPASLADCGAVAVHVSDTSQEPVVLVDVAAHAELDERDAPTAMAHSVLHEMRHAYQEMHEMDTCEYEAEDGSETIPF